MDELAEVLAPDLLAVEVVAEEARRAERGDDELAVSDRRRGGEGIGAVGRLLLAVVLDPELPQHLAVGAIEAHERAAIDLVDRLRDEDAIAPDDGRRIAA